MMLGEWVSNEELRAQHDLKIKSQGHKWGSKTAPATCQTRFEELSFEQVLTEQGNTMGRLTRRFLAALFNTALPVEMRLVWRNKFSADARNLHDATNIILAAI